MNKQWMYLLWPVALILLLLVVRTFVLDGDAVTRAGEKAYIAYCQSCHGEQGEGFKEIIPPLAGADYLNEHLDELPCLIIKGIKGEIEVNGVIYNQPMAGVGDKLSTAQVQGLIQYMQTSWGNNGKSLNFKEVSERRNACEGLE